MTGKTRIVSLGFFTICGFVITILPTAVHAQSRHRMQAPESLLEVLAEEDRRCVMQNGALRKSVSVHPIQLASNGSRQILVKGSGICLCGAQNCYFWIYRKSGANHELLLTGAGSTKVTAGQQSAMRYRDVISESHASANETIIRTYRFDGSKYQLQRCVNRAYYDDNGNYTKRPTYRPC